MDTGISELRTVDHDKSFKDAENLLNIFPLALPVRPSPVKSSTACLPPFLPPLPTGLYCR